MQMDTTQDIGAMMQAYAAQAVELARDFKVELDYSESSLEQVEALLSGLHDELQSWDAKSSTPASSPPAQQVDELAKIWGGYLGEVVRRRFGGEWTIEKYPAGDFLIVALNVNGARLYPSMKIHRRLSEGSSENLWSFYQAMREKLAAMPGAQIQ